MTYLEQYMKDNPECPHPDFAIGMYYPGGRHPDGCPPYSDCAACWKTEMPTDTPTIKDSGNRTEFASGAVRDVQEGKGRCDLLPLDVIGQIYADETDQPTAALVLGCISDFIRSGKTASLRGALQEFLLNNTPFGDGNWSTMWLEVAKHFEAGAKKYGERNWEKGIPVQRYIDSGIRHYLKWLRGDKDEPHDRAFCWNLLCAIWTCQNKPDLNEYAPKASGANTCVSCGAVIPEGTDHCLGCEGKYEGSVDNG